MSTYSATILADSPYLFCRLNETALGTVVDSSPNNFTISHVNTGAITLQEDALTFENELTFSTLFGKDLSANYGHALLSNTLTGSFPSTAISLEAWVKPGTNGTIWKGIYGYVIDSSTEYVQLALYYNNTPRLKIGGVLVADAGNIISSGQIYHIVATWENTTGVARIYVDGVLKIENTSQQIGYTIPPNHDLLIGRGLFASEGIEGWLDNVAIYNYVLTAQQVKNHFLAGKALELSTSTIPHATISLASGGLKDIGASIHNQSTLPQGSGILSGPVIKNVVISAIAATSPTTIRINFSLPVTRSPALTLPDNYEITPTLKVLSVVPENVTNPNYVDLITEEMREGENYTITIYNSIEAA
jgi:hypothetical protein